MAIKVGVIGAFGKMGAEVCRAVEAEPGLELAARIGRSDDISSIAGCDVAVEFTEPGTAMGNIRGCLTAGVHVVVGTTGLSEDDVAEIERLCGDAGANVLIAPNFAIGALLMMRFAQQAAPFFESAEIVERHHPDKKDAPSGTSLRTAALMGGEVPIHSLRVAGSVAHQEVILGTTGETLTIRHDSLARSSFVPGVIAAIKAVGDRPGVTVGLEHILFDE